MEPKPPVLTRNISENVSFQRSGDCFAHSIARVVVKAFRKQYPFLFYIENPTKLCNKMYLYSQKFYNCNKDECKQITLLELQQQCQPAEINSLILFMYIYSIIVHKFGCNGAFTYDCYNYLVYNVLYNRDFITTQCFIHPTLCDYIRPRILHNLAISPTKQKLIYSVKYYNYKYVGYPAYPTTQQKIMFNSVVNPAIYFFDAIQHAIDNELYLTLSINGNFIKWKNDNPEKIYTSKISLNTKDTWHSITIINYDYSNVSNKSFTVKNSWGIEYPIFTITEEELLLLSTLIGQSISITYLDYGNITKEFIDLLNTKDRPPFLHAFYKDRVGQAELLAEESEDVIIVPGRGGKSLHKKQKRHKSKKLKKIKLVNTK
jgi:hypothetical protein